MTTKQFIVEHTGKPFASAVPEGTPWYEFSKHSTLSAAMKRVKKEQAICRKNIGGWTWDDCYRIRKPDGTLADWSDWYEFENHIG